MPLKPRKPLCPGCAEAQELIARIARQPEQTTITTEQIIATLPLLLETAVSYLLSEFDYELEIGSRTAEAIRMVAMAADRAQVLLEAQEAQTAPRPLYIPR